jgi:hypothetical protein
MAQSVARKGAPALRIAYPIWVFSVILTPMPPLPVAPYERTSLDQPGWSGSCQQRTHAPQQTMPSFDHLDGFASSNYGTSRQSEKALTPSHPRLPSTPWYQLFAVLKP